MKKDISVSKCDHAGIETIRYPAVVLESDDKEVVVEARFGLEPRQVGSMRLEPNDRFVETYYADRWYNMHAVFGADADEFKGWYCNISYPPEIGRDLISYRDLALDLVVSPGGVQTVLDEDEFEALDIPAPDRQKALDALTNLRQEFSARLGI
jgi:hypothetical protein